MQQSKKESILQIDLSFTSIWCAGGPFILLLSFLDIWYLSNVGLGLLIVSLVFENEQIAGEF